MVCAFFNYVILYKYQSIMDYEYWMCHALYLHFGFNYILLSLIQA